MAAPLLDLIWPVKNPGTVVCQFFSSMLAGIHGAFKVLCATAAVVDFESWYDSAPACVDEARESIWLASLISWIRNLNRYFDWPWPVLINADARRSRYDKLQVCSRFRRSCKYCFDEGHCARLFAEFDDEQLASDEAVLSVFERPEHVEAHEEMADQYHDVRSLARWIPLREAPWKSA